jgi:hypothetical protein
MSVYKRLSDAIYSSHFVLRLLYFVASLTFTLLLFFFEVRLSTPHPKKKLHPPSLFIYLYVCAAFIRIIDEIQITNISRVCVCMCCSNIVADHTSSVQCCFSCCVLLHIFGKHLETPFFCLRLTRNYS